jgi:class 3 adenylate cyclase
VKADRGGRLALQALETLYGLVLLAWLVLRLERPLAAVGRLLHLPGLPRLAEALRLPDLLSLPSVLFAPGSAALTAATVLLYLIPAIRLYKLACLFLDTVVPPLADPRRTFPILLSLASSALAMAAILVPVVREASSWGYFSGLPPALIALFAFSLAHNAFFLSRLIARLNRKDESYREYLEFRRGAGRGFLRGLLAQGIQKRLALSFTVLTLLIIGVLSLVLMRNFSQTILAALIENGKGLAERTASVIRANFGDDIAVEDYFAIEARKNAEGAFRFEELAFFRRTSTAGEFQAAASTLPLPSGRLLREPGSGLEHTGYRFDPASGLYEFQAPVQVRGILIGLVQLAYDRAVIYEPYFRAQFQVLLIAALFLYLTVFLIYVVGRGIAFPILFLRMSVASISRTLAGMIKGQVRISSDLLQYRDRVRTRDEIKLLSDEIGNMTTVIRGVIPYISASTLKHAHRDTPSTERRELAFLFTDVRGFTTLCEGLSPSQVVELINHYLDLQSTVILDNGGDIDKFVGDAIMAVFEGPRKELAACRASMQIRSAMAQDKEQRRLGGQTALSIGIGIHSGPVVFGSVGAKDRMDFTSIGDTVNLAARLEGANKVYGTKSLITGSVQARVREHFLCREIDLLTVKGKRQPVRIYEVLQELKSASDKLREIKKHFEGGLAMYRRQQWPEAQRSFRFLVERYQDEASEVFLRRIDLFRRSPPPADWDGVFDLTVK